MMRAQVMSPAPSTVCVSLEDAGDPARVGGKAAPLARAIAAGFRVPEAFVLTVEAADLDGEGLRIEVAAQLSRLGGERFAVRSSAVGEDGLERSFAGQLDTRLELSRDQVLPAIEHCWRSAGALRTLRYGADLGAVALIVQRMVPAQAAGVAFSADPRTGERDRVVIDATNSLGDRLVSGEVDPESWLVAGGSCERTRALAVDVLTPDRARRVAELAQAMEALFGCPQDVEWAFDGEDLYLLQSRPITALPAAPIPIPVEVPEGSWERDDHHGVMSPLGWAWIQPYPKALARAFASSGAPIKDMQCTRIGGQLYNRMVMEGPESDKLPPRWVLWLASRLVPGMRRGNRLALDFIEGEAYMEILREWEQGGRQELRAAFAAAVVDDPQSLSDAELLAAIDDTLKLSAESLAMHARLHGPPFFAVARLSMFLEDELPHERASVLELVTGSSQATTSLHGELEALAARHGAEFEALEEFPRSWASLAHACPGLAGDLRAWLHHNRFRMMHYGPGHPSFGERPEQLLSIMEGVVAGLDDERAKGAERRAHEAIARVRDQLDEALRARFDRLLDQARRCYGLREGNAPDTVSKPAGLLRHYVLELGRRIEAQIGRREYAVYLYPEEHADALAGRIDDLAARIERRRGEESWALRNRGPRLYGAAPPPLPPADAFPSGLRQLMRVIAFLEEHEKLPPTEPGEGVHGIGIGTRVVSGRVRVVERPEQMRSVRHGEIVVCRITSPEWAVGLGRVAALITDEGATLSHPAIVAREFDVPAIVGTGDATQKLQTGDRVRVDPVEGSVVKL